MMAQPRKTATAIKALNGKWDLRQERIDLDKTSITKVLLQKKNWIQTPVPGDIHQGLIGAGIIEEPSVGLNAKKATWTRDRSWWLRKIFSVTASQLGQSQRIELVLDGLDCNAWIYINGKLIGEHYSAFRPFVKDIKECVKPGNNTIVIRLTDGLDQVSKDDLEKLKGYIPVDAVRPERSESRRVFVRKAQYSWGWDWSPESSTTGITGDAFIRFVYSDYIEDVSVRVAGSPRRPCLAVTVKVQRADSFKACAAKVDIKVKDTSGKLVSCSNKKVLLQSGSTFTVFDLPVDNPQLWWPNGAGEQPLYTVEAKISGKGVVSDQFERRFGIRFTEIDTDGKMCVMVNDKKVFCKGANFIPADMFYARTDSATYRKLVLEARNANFNMLRVWGGGIYLPDEFYRACDEYGIMVWHDFMFACAPYPDYIPSFVQEVRQEVEHQLTRLRNHPSIMLWCGGNENIWARAQSENKENGSVIAGKILPEAIQSICPDIPYFYGSPYGDGAKNHLHLSNTDSGDCHCWDDTMMSPSMDTRITFGTYDKIKAKFISEYGFPGACNKKTVLNYVSSKESYCTNSQAWKYHYNTFAENTVEQAIKKHYIDSENLSLDDFLYYSGLVQGRVYAYSLESFRQRQDCCGGLFWMYNDCWGEVGWSIIDYYLRRKISYWFVRRSLAAKKLIIRRTAANRLRLTLVNDSLEKLSGSVKLWWQSFSGTENKQLFKKNLSASPMERICVECKHPDVDFRGGLWLAESCDSNTGIVAAAYYDADFRQLVRFPAKVTVKKVCRCDNGIVVELFCDEFAHAVELNLPQGTESDDNYFDIFPGKVKKVTLTGLCEMPSQLISRSL